MPKPDKHIDTKLICAGEPVPRIEGAVSMPIFQSSTFESEGGSSYDTIKYIRLNNTPNHDVLHAKLSALENAEAALVTASGRLRRILGNRGDSARKHAPAGGRVEVVSEPTAGGGGTLRVIDNGPGIPAEHLFAHEI